MRFNDLLRTVLAQDGEGMASAITRWRQCIDLAAQYDVSGAMSAYRLSDDESAAIFDVLAAVRPQLGLEQRVASIVELGSRLRSMRLCRFLAQDHPAVVSAVMTRARLADEDWAMLIPSLGPLARSILRRRTDLGPAALAVLERFGSTDLALPPAQVAAARHLHPANDATPPAAPAHEPPPAAPFAARVAASLSDGLREEPSEIRRIVERIERFTAERIRVAAEREAEGPPAAGNEASPLDLQPAQVLPSQLLSSQAMAAPGDGPLAFTFTTDEKGRFTDVEGVHRAAVAGLGIGQAALDGLSGADGQALGAFRRRADFRDARFTIADGPLAGEWRLSGTPGFDPASGQFLGYAGAARRERPHEQIVKSAGGNALPEWGGLSASGARQLIHELRTPLSAIYAYAEMIEGQLVGPVSSEYRALARRIIADARELVATFDDLDLAGRIARGEDGNETDVIDVVALLQPLFQRFGQADAPPRVDLKASGPLPAVRGDREQMERMFSHLVRGGYAALGPAETLVIRLRHLAVTHTLSIVIERPGALRGMSEDMLLDHESPVDEALTTVPPLGLAFTLRLVRGIAARAGGQFLISPDSFELVLPAAMEARGGRERGF